VPLTGNSRFWELQKTFKAAPVLPSGVNKNRRPTTPVQNSKIKKFAVDFKGFTAQEIEISKRGSLFLETP